MTGRDDGRGLGTRAGQDGASRLVLGLPGAKTARPDWSMGCLATLAAVEAGGRHVGADAAAAVPEPGRGDALYPGPAAPRTEHPRREGPQR